MSPILTAKVQAAIDDIRPYLLSDGGDIELVEITSKNIVRVKLLGACRSCSMSPMTMRAGVEETIRKVVPEILGVEEVSEEG